MANYLDLLNVDGSRNARAFAEILDRRVTAEINLRLCGAAGLITPPRDVAALGDIPAWRAEQVATLGLGPLGKDELKRIRDHEFDELEAWVKAMQRGAATQRLAMLAAEKRSEIDHGAFAIAAE